MFPDLFPKIKFLVVIFVLFSVACICSYNSNTQNNEPEITATEDIATEDIRIAITETITFEDIQVTATEDIKFGYTIEERKQIFYEIVEAEDRAQLEAWEAYPTPDPFSSDYTTEKMEEALMNAFDYFDKYTELYRQEVAEKYNLSIEELKEISNEGVFNDWPFPPFP
jgi:hypothetical protein